MTTDPDIDSVLRELAPQALAVIVRRYGDFASCEDAVQEALIAAIASWPANGRPDNPLGWVVRVASRRMADHHRSAAARRHREELASSWLASPPDPLSAHDDTLMLLFMCSHPSLTPALAIPLTLRAVGGLTTREIATAFLVPDATMAQRISRAKSKMRASGEPLTIPSHEAYGERLRSVLHVLYLLFNEGYAASSGPELARTDLSGEAIRLTRQVHASLPDDPEVAGLLALMLLTDARRPARTGVDGELVPLNVQQRILWDRNLIDEGVRLVNEALRRGHIGEYQVQAAIAVAHDQAVSYSATDWREILTLYTLLERMTGNPMVTLNRAIAQGMVYGPAVGLASLSGLELRLGEHHRLHSVRAHLLELSGDTDLAIAEFRAAASKTASLREQQYLLLKAASLATPLADD